MLFKIDGETMIISKDVMIIDDEIISAVLDNKIKHITFEKGSMLSRFGLGIKGENSYLESVDFSSCESLNTLDMNAFYKCEKLKNVNLKNCKSLTTLSLNSFAFCSSLEELDFTDCDNLRDISTRVFRNCKNLKQIKLDNCKNLKSISKGAFEDCKSLESLDFSNGKIVYVGDFAFSGCDNLRSVSFANQPLHDIGVGIFSDCKSLKIIDFSNCKELHSFVNVYGENQPSDVVFDVVDLRGCDLEIVQNFNAKNINITQNPKNKYYSQPKFADSFNSDAIINLYDYKGDLLCSINNNDKNYNKLNMFSVNFFAHTLRQNIKMPTEFINVARSNSELQFLIKNYDGLKEFELDNKYEQNPYLKIARLLGFFGVDNYSIDKNDLIAYKNLLAKNLINHKIVNNIISKSNSEKINQLIQRETDRIARNYSLEKLILLFIKNNILNNEKCNDLFKHIEFLKLDKDVNLKFAGFFVQNFDDIMANAVYEVDGNKDFQYQQGAVMPLSEIYKNFNELLVKSNKKVLTRSNYQRFTVFDCSYDNQYDGVLKGNEGLAKVCGSACISSDGFMFLQDVFEIGKSKKSKQILKIDKDTYGGDITYEFIEKDNPIGLVLGNITNCCQRYGKTGQNTMIVGATDENAGFVTINYKGRIIGQALVWYNKENKVVALDNIEIPLVYDRFVNNTQKREVIECIKRICSGLYKTMNNNNYKVDDVVIGKSNTKIKSLENEFELADDKKYNCPFDVYTDIDKQGQFVVIKNGKMQSNMINKSIEK